MAGLLDTLSDEQTQVCRLLPYPLAAAWQQVLQAPTLPQLEARLHTQVEVVVRTLGVLLLIEYLRGPADANAELVLDHLNKPEPEDWLAVVTKLGEVLHRRTEPAVMLAPLVAWRRRHAHADRDGLQQLTYVIGLRRSGLTATGVEESFEATQQVEELLEATLDLLESLRWLGAWRMLRVVEQATLRHKGFSGRVQVFAGGAETPDSIAASWTAHLVVDALYLVDPRATQMLEVSPLLRILPHPRTRRPLCFLFDRAENLHRLTLIHDSSGVHAETSIAGPHGEMAFEQWLAMRSAHGAWLANQDLLDSLTVDPLAQQFAVARRTAPARRISGLSQHAYRRQVRGESLFTSWRSRANLGVQVAVAVALVAAAFWLLAPRQAVRVPVQIADEMAAPLAIHRDHELAAPEPASQVRAESPPAGPSAPAVPVGGQGLASVPVSQLPASVATVVVAAVVQAPVVVLAPAVVQAPVVVEPKANPTQPEPQSKRQLRVQPQLQVQPQLVAPPVAVKPQLAAVDVQPTAAVAVAGAAAREPSAIGGEFSTKGLRDLTIRPAYAILKFLQAKEAGDRRADWHLAQAHFAAGHTAKCRHHALLALAKAASDTAANDLVVKCGGDPRQAARHADPAEDGKVLTQKLYAEGYAIIYGDTHTKAERRRMAKELYSDAAARGLAKGHTGLAQIYLFGETNRAKCYKHAQLAVVAGERGEAERLVAVCKPKHQASLAR
ncbi:MAG: hypothetical protein EXR77_02380 [Myxococcales bacterium]|nr:hypothetical protein [Myxococcales bacterium]